MNLVQPDVSSILDMLRERQPSKGLPFAAILELTDAPIDQKQRFMTEYAYWLRTQSTDPAVQADPEGTARMNMAYAVVYYGEETTKKWYDAFPDFEHPVYRREIPWPK